MKPRWVILVIASLVVWPGIPLAKVYGPYVMAYFVHDGGK